VHAIAHPAAQPAARSKGLLEFIYLYLWRIVQERVDRQFFSQLGSRLEQAAPAGREAGCICASEEQVARSRSVSHQTPARPIVSETGSAQLSKALPDMSRWAK